MLASYDCKKIISVIDSRTWQHSWHLPLDGNGIDWSDKETIRRCMEVVTKYEADAKALAERCKEARELLEREIRETQREQETSGNG